MTLMLDDPDDYEGGELQICHMGNFNDVITVKPKKGDIVFFASWMPHRVAPVTSGTRRSIDKLCSLRKNSPLWNSTAILFTME